MFLIVNQGFLANTFEERKLQLGDKARFLVLDQPAEISRSEIWNYMTVRIARK